MTKFELPTKDDYDAKVNNLATDAIQNTKDALVQALLNEIQQASAVKHYIEHDIERFIGDTFAGMNLDFKTAAGVLFWSKSDPDDPDSIVSGIKDVKQIVEVLGNRTLNSDVFNKIMELVQNIVNDFNENLEAEIEDENETPDGDDSEPEVVTDSDRKNIAVDAIEERI